MWSGILLQENVVLFIKKKREKKFPGIEFWIEVKR